MSDYEPPRVDDLGDVAQLTEGQHYSNIDGHSGTAGNRGEGGQQGQGHGAGGS